VERVKFDPALLENPELTRVAYQRGDLFGWEMRSYPLEKFGRCCVYCGRGETALVEVLGVVGVPIGTWSGGRTRWNRDRFGIAKAHCLDALCVGDVAGVQAPVSRTLSITAQGRGRYQRTNVDESGFPRGYLTRAKRLLGFSTGDLVRARVPEHLKTGGIHLGRVVIRASGSFRVGKLDGISAKYCQVVQRADGYSYALRKDAQRGGASSTPVNAGASEPQ
jgi:hypothetical protein